MTRAVRQRRHGRAAVVCHVLVRVLLVCGLFSLTLPITRMAQTETLRQRVDALMTVIKRNNWGSTKETLAGDLAQLRGLVKQLERSSLSQRYLQASIADAHALELDYPIDSQDLSKRGYDSETIEKISNAYRAASLITPKDSYLVARHARLISRTNQIELFDTLLARAATLGPHDYNTIRQVAYLGISKWPRLSCTTRVAVLAVIANGLRIDDAILARWNTDLGQRRMGETLEALFERFDFDLDWAQLTVARCG